MTHFHNNVRASKSVSICLLLAGLAATPAFAGPLELSKDGAISVPAMEVPSSSLMSPEGNASRVEHILTKRKNAGKPTQESYQGTFGPGLERMKAAYDVTIEPAKIGGINVLIYKPRKGIEPKNANKTLLNLHGGGFVACFVECGGMESIPIAATTGFKVVSVDYRMAPANLYPAATEDAVAVYRELLKETSAPHIGIFGCSAGGILTAQVLAALPKSNLPMPGAAGIACAGADSDMGGDSRIIGRVLGDAEGIVEASAERGPAPLGYMSGVARNDPLAFPARNSEALKLFPPTVLVTGTRDFAMSSVVFLHSRLVANGVEARLHIWEGGRHAFFYDQRIPEAREVYSVIGGFFTARL